jgi:hypothetical protein
VGRAPHPDPSATPALAAGSGSLADTDTVDHRLLAVLVTALAGACGSESTSFRPTDRADPHHAGPPSAAYDAAIAGQTVAKVHVWSSGGYLSAGDEPMTHLGFEINSATMQPLTVDVEALELAVFDATGAALPSDRATSRPCRRAGSCGAAATRISRSPASSGTTLLG